MKTIHEIKVAFGEGRPAMGGSVHHLTIPAGTRVSATGDGQYFVEDLSWLDRRSMAWHDANYYGIRLNADQVEV